MVHLLFLDHVFVKWKRQQTLSQSKVCLAPKRSPIFSPALLVSLWNTSRESLLEVLISLNKQKRIVKDKQLPLWKKNMTLLE